MFKLRETQIRMLMTMHSLEVYSLVEKKSRHDLLATAVHCWQKYPSEKMESVAFITRFAEFSRVEVKPGSHENLMFLKLPGGNE